MAEPPEGTAPSRVSVEVVRRMFGKLPVPAALQRKEANANGNPPPPRDPPHVMLVPRLRSIGLMEFNRAHEAIDEGRACVEQALPALRRYL